MRTLSLLLFVFFVLYACASKKEGDEVVADTTDAVVLATVLPTEDTSAIARIPMPAGFGERLWITGDFDGDGAADTIRESVVSQLTNQEMAKEFDADDWGNNVKEIMEHEPLTRLYSNLTAVDTFVVTDERQQAGVCFFVNLGDLDGEPGDEFGYAVYWADYSNLNTYCVMSLKDHQFTQVLSFAINEMVSWDKESLFDNGFFIKSIAPGEIVYKFYSDSATVEEATYTFQ